ncbi:MAG: hypothetical protein ACRYGM_05245 [Janthinobacterium lividum]
MRHPGFVECVHLGLLGVADFTTAASWSQARRTAALNLGAMWNGAEFDWKTMRLVPRKP